MEKTLFQKIADGEIPADIVYQDAEVVAFRDISPQAPHHILIIPRRPISGIMELQTTDVELVGKMVLLAQQLARELGLAERGFRLVINSGAQGGQTVPHLHLHLLGGRSMRWPPG